MNINIFGANQIEIFIQSRDLVIFFSYNTPVAYVRAGENCVCVGPVYSRTTTKHIKSWIASSGNIRNFPVKTVTTEEIQHLVEDI